MTRPVVALAFALAATAGCRRAAQLPAPAPDAGFIDGVSCVPTVFGGGELTLAPETVPDCDVDPTACASPCANGPLAEDWRTFAIEPTFEALEAVYFSSSVVDASGNLFLATCEAATNQPNEPRSCAMRSFTSTGGRRSFSELGDGLQAPLTTVQALVLAQELAVVVEHAGQGGVLLSAQQTSNRSTTWVFDAQEALEYVGLHDDAGRARLLLVVNAASGAEVHALDRDTGTPIFRRRLSRKALASVLDGDGNLYLGLVTSDWERGAGFASVLAFDRAGCLRWEVDSNWHGPASQMLPAVSGGLLVAFGDRVLRAMDGTVAYKLPARPSAVLLGPTYGYGVTGPVSPGPFDAAASGPIALFGFDRASGIDTFRLELPPGTVKTTPLLTSRGTLVLVTTDHNTPGLVAPTVMREVTRHGRQLWACVLPRDQQGGYLAGASITAGRLVTADVTVVPTGGTPPLFYGVTMRAFTLGKSLRPSDRGWVMQGGNPSRGGRPKIP